MIAVTGWHVARLRIAGSRVAGAPARRSARHGQTLPLQTLLLSEAPHTAYTPNVFRLLLKAQCSTVPWGCHGACSAFSSLIHAGQPLFGTAQSARGRNECLPEKLHDPAEAASSHVQQHAAHG